MDIEFVLLCLRCLWRSRGRQDLAVWNSEIWAGDKDRESSSQGECGAVNEYVSDVRSMSVFRKLNVTVMCSVEDRRGWAR